MHCIYGRIIIPLLNRRHIVKTDMKVGPVETKFHANWKLRKSPFHYSITQTIQVLEPILKEDLVGYVA